MSKITEKLAMVTQRRQRLDVRRRFTDEEEDEILAKYNEGFGPTKIAQALKANPQTIYAALNRARTRAMQIQLEEIKAKQGVE